MGKAATIFVTGVVGIGLATALFSNGRQFAQGATAVGAAGSNLLGTAIKG